ncbi:MAG: hypothetical protein ACLSDO_01565 [Anaerotruncus colihominis]
MGIWFSIYGVLLPEAVDGAGSSDWLGAALTACGGADAAGWLETALETSGATGSDTTGSDAACDEAAGNWEDTSAWDAAGSPCPQPARGGQQSYQQKLAQSSSLLSWVARHRIDSAAC